MTRNASAVLIQENTSALNDFMSSAAIEYEFKMRLLVKLWNQYLPVKMIF